MALNLEFSEHPISGGSKNGVNLTPQTRFWPKRGQFCKPYGLGYPHFGVFGHFGFLTPHLATQLPRRFGPFFRKTPKSLFLAKTPFGTVLTPPKIVQNRVPDPILDHFLDPFFAFFGCQGLMSPLFGPKLGVFGTPDFRGVQKWGQFDPFWYRFT